ncbi:shikimate kinase [Falsibacillus albus]|uniref:Shikimate kinase n=1 Tax=Falsibacillus albus TaxID=2478915 RepID=A0A3L7K7H5_9BACI|nr:shikimate kinase [Falsibacillus albus]RLQ98249.1 shikimate kinase [Falsibacillus albus]
MLYFIGYMGAGKTTVGKEMAELNGLALVDLDHAIEMEQEKSIKEIFHEDGQDYFRELETAALRKFSVQNGIVTTGGGVILKEENRELMKKTGEVIYLRCRPETLYMRLKYDETRPLIQDKSQEEFISMFRQRERLYEEAATLIIDTDGMGVEEIVQTIQDRLNS